MRYPNLLEKEKQKLAKRLDVTLNEMRKYVLPTNADFNIMCMCKQLEKKRLTKEDRYLVTFIKSQLADDWRAPLVKKLHKLVERYK